MPGKTAQKTWGKGLTLPKGAAASRLEAENGWRGLCSLLRGARLQHPETVAAATQAEGAAFPLESTLVSLPAGATSPSLGLKCNLAKVILLYEEGVLPSA